MRKGLLLAGAIFGASILADTANAVTLRIDEEQKIVFGSRAKIYGQYLGDQGDEDKADLRFTLNDARIYFKYRFNKFLTAATQFSLWGPNKVEGKLKNGKVTASDFEVIDAFLNISFAPEVNLMLGLYKVPFQRHSGLQSGWTFLFPTGPAYGVKGYFTNPVADRASRSGSRSPGATLWGNIAGGMFKYYIGVFDGSDEDTTINQKTAFAVRVQFTPTMLGFKPEKGYVLKNNYAGAKDVLTIGVSYVSQPFGGGKDDQSSWGFDILWEQKFGSVAPALQFGYVSHENWKGNPVDDRNAWLVQGQLTYTEKVWVGKPAIVARYMQAEEDKNNTEPRVFGAGVSYYFKGSTNRIALVFDNVDLDNGTDYTDVTLSIYFNF